MQPNAVLYSGPLMIIFDISALHCGSIVSTFFIVD